MAVADATAAPPAPRSTAMGHDAGDTLTETRTLTNDAAQIHRAATDLLTAAADAGHGESAAFALRLALEEAVRNAFEHGCRDCPGRAVVVGWDVSPARVVIRVEDPGPGFDPAGVPDPTADENLERPCGRGLLLMRAYMSSVEFNERGNAVTMVYDPARARPAAG
ncbi:MAG: ATP-binding protein [Planctomycetota bacterium]|nr:MAG: ATP-binding protein [Planctomycetota bacterium]